MDPSQERGARKRAIANSYSAVLGADSSRGFRAFTFEQALDERIEQIEGGGTARRPGALARVARVEADLLSAIASIRAGGTG